MLNPLIRKLGLDMGRNNEIYLLVQVKCVHCNLMLQAERSRRDPFSQKGKQMWGVTDCVFCSERGACTTLDLRQKKCGHYIR